MPLINFGKKKTEMTVATFNKEEFEKQEAVEKALKESKTRLDSSLEQTISSTNPSDLSHNLDDLSPEERILYGL